MQYNEVKGIAKSIARWVWKRDPYCYQEFIDRQSRKGRKGGLKGGIARSEKYQAKRNQALKLREQGYNNTQIANVLNISRRSIINWFKD